MGAEGKRCHTNGGQVGLGEGGLVALRGSGLGQSLAWPAARRGGRGGQRQSGAAARWCRLLG